RLKLRDLTPDRREQRLSIAQLPLDPRPVRRAGGDCLGLLDARTLEPPLARLYLALERGDLADHFGVLMRDALNRLEPADHVVEARRTEHDGERGLVVAGRVERDHPLGQRRLGAR